MSKIPEQKQKIFLAAEYEIGVAKINSKEYQYNLYKENVSVYRFTTNVSPSSLNPTSNFVNEVKKRLDGNVKQELDGLTVTFNKEQIIEKTMACLNYLQDKFDGYLTNKKENEEKQAKKDADLKLQKLEEASDEYVNHLYSLNCEPIQYLHYFAEWASGGETQNIIKGFVCHLSTYLGIKPCWFVPSGKAGEGKSTIEECSTKLMPPEAFLDGRISESALYRKSKEDPYFCDCKIMRMGDMGGDKDIDKWEDTIDRYKELTTEGQITKTITGDGRDEDGEKKLLDLHLEGYCSVSMTTVNSEGFDGQIISRGVNVSPDATNAQVKSFVRFNKGKIYDKREFIFKNEVKYLHNYINYLKFNVVNEVKVINLYWECLENWFKDSEYYKRNITLYSSLVETITLLNYDFREKITIGDDEEDYQVYIISSKEDNQLLSELFNPSHSLSEESIKIFNLMVKWFKKGTLDDAISEYDNYMTEKGNLKDYDGIFSVSMVKSKGSKTNRYKNLNYGEIMNSLLNVGLIENLGKMVKGNNNVYALNRFEPIEKADIKFDDDCIEKCIVDATILYGIPYMHLRKVVDEDILKKTGEYSVCDLEVPPWVSSQSLKYLLGVNKYLVGATYEG